MDMFLYFIIGALIMAVIVKLIINEPINQKVAPTLDNYKNTIFIDEEGKLYKYELEEINNI